jgi:predicted Rossmann fold nucleotide-binding protein DprA/Smf involved in DNA uptake
MPPTPDSLALLTLCSQLGLDGDSPSPLTLRDWNPLARRLKVASLRPADLLAGKEVLSRLELPPNEATRIDALVSRDIQPELHRLELLGIYPLTRVDPDYPERYRQRLKDSAPAVLFYSGEKALLGQPGIAVVGSRHLDDAGQECARFVGIACGMSGLVLYSGGAKGVDTLSMESALESRGTAVAVLADSLEKVVGLRQDALRRRDLCLVTPYSPKAGFSVGAAMGRNRLIYTLADFAIVIACNAGTGGTWAGAIEALKNNWFPVFVLHHEHMPEGNKLLLQKGAFPFPHPFREKPVTLLSWLQAKASTLPAHPQQPNLL